MTRGASRTGTILASSGHRPSRARCSTMTIITPNTITSKLPALPNTLGRMSCSHCLSTVITPAPTSAPHTCPAPPTTAMNRYSMPIWRPKGVGLTKRWRWAYSQPAAQAWSAAITKITMRARDVSTPIASAITMPPLSARIARPSRESSRLRVVNKPSSTKAHTR